MINLFINRDNDIRSIALSRIYASKEYQMVMYLLDRVFRPECDNIQKPITSEIDWDHFIKIACRHRLVPLLNKSLSRYKVAEVPERVCVAIYEKAHLIAKRNLFFISELIHVLGLFQKNEIDALTLKGPLLASLAYDNVSLRMFDDLDIFVSPHQLTKAISILETYGYYRAIEQDSQLNITQENTCTRYLDQYAFFHKDKPVRLELHWRFTETNLSPYNEDSCQQLWSRTSTVSLAGTLVTTLPLEETVLYLCMHGSKHEWTRLQWLCDVAAILTKHKDIDWRKVVDRAIDFNEQRSLVLGLSLVHHIFGNTIPEWIWQYSRKDPVVTRLIKNTPAKIFGDTKESSESTSLHLILRHFIYKLQLQSSVRYKALFFLKHFVPIYLTDWQKFRLPHSMFFLYYLLRPMRLLGKHILRWR